MMMRLSKLGLDLVYTALPLHDADNTLDSARSVASQAPVPEPNRNNLPLRLTRPPNSATLPNHKKPRNSRV